MNIKKAMILCAGFGKRLLPLTNEKPKPLLSIGSKLLIDYSISFLHKIGIEEMQQTAILKVDGRLILKFLMRKNYLIPEGE